MVMEDVLPPGGPDWRTAGVIVTRDVAGFERAKLRILNGAHSALAYLGVMRGHETVADAMRDDILAAFVRTMVERGVAPGLGEISDLDLPAYIDAVFTRFRNPAIRHLLSQIAWDGSQKLPYRMLDSVIAARATGLPLERLLLPVAAWMRFVERTARRGETLVDPLRDRLVAAATDPAAAVDRFLAIDQVFPSTLAGDPEVRRVLGDAHQFADDPATLDHVLRTLS